MKQLLALLFFVSPLYAAEPVPLSTSVQLPELTAPVVPPAPNSAQKLNANEYYVIADDTVACIVLTSPDGYVTKTYETGPIKIRGMFTGGNGKVETKTFKQKNIYILEAAKTGRIELLVIPVGAVTEKDIVRRTIDVDAGQGPIPPPTPDKPTATLVATPSIISAGQSATLYWNTTGISASIDNGLGSVIPVGQQVVSPSTTTTYTITTVNGTAIATATATVVVAAPTDPFTTALQTAYASETDANKAKYVSWMAQVYKGFGAVIDLPTVVTVQDLFDNLHNTLHNTALGGTPIGSMKAVSKVIGQDINVVLGGTAAGVAPANALNKDAVKKAFVKYAAALSTLK